MSSRTPKISIITINFNNNEGLIKTIGSVINQTYKDFEYIIIDGNSNDGSKETLEKHNLDIDYWVSEPDSGIYNAMNKGIRAAKGDYLLFLNSGDWLYSSDVLAIGSNSINGIFDIYYGNAIFKSIENEIVVNYDQKISFKFFLDNNFCHQATFIKKKLFDYIFFYNENLKIVSDWEFFIYSVCIANVSIKHLDIIISYYDYNGISSKNENNDIILVERQQVFDKYFSKFLNDYKPEKEIPNKSLQKILYIKQHKIAWKLLKGFSNILLLFLPKTKRNLIK